MSVIVQPVNPVMRAVALELGGFESDTGGLGGWETLARPRQSAAAGWVGLPERTYAIPVVLDGVDAYGPDRDRVVAEDLAAVRSWGEPTAATGQPPILQLLGARGVSTADRWVLQTVEIGEYLTNSAGQLIQQELTVTFLQYVEPTIVKGPAAKSRAAKGKGKKGKAAKSKKKPKK